MIRLLTTNSVESLSTSLDTHSAVFMSNLHLSLIFHGISLSCMLLTSRVTIGIRLRLMLKYSLLLSRPTPSKLRSIGPLSCKYSAAQRDVMLTQRREYPYPPEWTLDGSSAGWNRVLSDQDKNFIMQRYPKGGIVRTTTDGVYLVNCFKGNKISSGIAYYANLSNNDGQQPTSYINVTQGSNVIWEGTPGSGEKTRYDPSWALANVILGTFPDGNKVSWSIVANAGTMAAYSNVGTAGNNFEHWNVYKDKYRLLYEVDGWQCFTVYWCFWYHQHWKE